MIRKLAQCPQEIINAAKNYDPARMTHYLMDVATLFHKFYNACRVQGEDEKLMQARISLCLAHPRRTGKPAQTAQDHRAGEHVIPVRRTEKKENRDGRSSFATL